MKGSLKDESLSERPIMMTGASLVCSFHMPKYFTLPSVTFIPCQGTLIVELIEVIIVEGSREWLICLSGRCSKSEMVGLHW